MARSTFGQFSSGSTLANGVGLATDDIWPADLPQRRPNLSGHLSVHPLHAAIEELVRDAANRAVGEARAGDAHARLVDDLPAPPNHRVEPHARARRLRDPRLDLEQIVE